ncbi:transposase [Halobacteriales archaeon SW_7_65_23]|nr:MAG: transposase [Halobacteriales archaeon SW_7_65_23]
MTDPTNTLPGVTAERIRKRLPEERDPKAIKRLVAAREYLDGLSVPAIEAKYGWPAQTIYSWLDRFEGRAFEDALYDTPSPGREPALDAAERRRLERALENLPAEAGYDASAWSTALVRKFLREKFDVEYSRRHVRRLMHEAGVPPGGRTTRSGPE